MNKWLHHPQFRIRGNRERRKLDLEELSYHELSLMVEMFYNCRKKTPEQLHRLGKEKHCELEDWLTPLEREFIMNECLKRGLADEKENEREYKRSLNGARKYFSAVEQRTV